MIDSDIALGVLGLLGAEFGLFNGVDEYNTPQAVARRRRAELEGFDTVEKWRKIVCLLKQEQARLTSESGVPGSLADDNADANFGEVNPEQREDQNGGFDAEPSHADNDGRSALQAPDMHPVGKQNGKLGAETSSLYDDGNPIYDDAISDHSGVSNTERDKPKASARARSPAPQAVKSTPRQRPGCFGKRPFYGGFE